MSDPELGDWSLGRLLSTAARMVERDWDAWLGRHGITHAGLLVLDALQEGPLSQGDLAIRSHVEQQTMSRIVDRLLRTGHITRERDHRDRRRLVIGCTAAGRTVYSAIKTSSMADDLVVLPLADPAAFRAELIRLIAARRHAD